MKTHLGAGLVWSGFREERDQRIGLGATWASLSDAARAGFSENYELAVEAFWRVQVTPRLSLKPDVQYVLHPGGDASLDDALVVGLRAEWTL